MFSRSGRGQLQTSQAIAFSRRDFLSAVSKASASAALFACTQMHAAAPKKQKVIIVTFGGGARDEETFAPQGQENIPHLMTSLVPQSTFYAQVVNHGILGHYVA